jgi:hypothetical protein
MWIEITAIPPRASENIQGIEAESLCEVSPEAGEHQVRGEDIALDLCEIS